MSRGDNQEDKHQNASTRMQVQNASTVSGAWASIRLRRIQKFANINRVGMGTGANSPGDISMEKAEQSKDPTWTQEEEACTGIVGRNFPRR